MRFINKFEKISQGTREFSKTIQIIITLYE